MPNRVSAFRRILVALVAMVLAAAMVPAPAAAEDVTVKIDNFAFVPETVTVKAGTTIVFRNDDDIPHLVVADNGSFRSKALDTGNTYSFAFTAAGEFPYYCGLHPHMRGKITVVP